MPYFCNAGESKTSDCRKAEECLVDGWEVIRPSRRRQYIRAVGNSRVYPFVFRRDNSPKKDSPVT